MKKYVFKPYSKIFPGLFQEEKARIAVHLKTALAIEHIGSTAIPGLGGKGIIDIAIAVNKQNMESASKQLQSLGYEFRPAFSTPVRFYFVIYLPDPEEGTRRYHVHLTYPENSEWKEFLAFRNYLREHPEKAEEYAKIKEQAVIEADQDGEKYRELKEHVFKEFTHTTKREITFKKAALSEKEHVLQWLQEPHIREFWDNSPEHLADIIIFMNGRKERSVYADGIFDYWIGFIHDEPYCLLMTSEILPTQDNLLEVWKAHLSQKGKTFSIDFMIGNKKYLARGLGAPTLEAFTQFISKEIDPSVDTFFIDPADSNPRAKHVYEKAGFKTVATFHRDFQDRKNVTHFLMVKNLST